MDFIIEQGEQLYEMVCSKDMEGIVAKPQQNPYKLLRGGKTRVAIYLDQPIVQSAVVRRTKTLPILHWPRFISSDGVYSKKMNEHVDLYIRSMDSDQKGVIGL